MIPIRFSQERIKYDCEIKKKKNRKIGKGKLRVFPMGVGIKNIKTKSGKTDVNSDFKVTNINIMRCEKKKRSGV